MRLVWLCSVPILVIPVGPSLAEDSPEWTICVARAGPAITSDAIVAACTSILDAAKEPPDRLASAAFSRGLAEQRLGSRDKAYADFDAALRFDPKFTKVFLARGYDAVAGGKYDAAIKEFNQAIAIDPKLVEAYYGRGLAYDASHQLDKAIKDHQQAISLNPKYAQAYFGLGLVYREKGQTDRAIENFSKAIELDPQYAQALYNRGNAYGAQNKIDPAIHDYDEAIRIEPDYAKALYMRGLANWQTGKTDQALADLDAAVRINPNFTDAIQQRDRLKAKLADAAPQNEADKKQENALLGLYLARAGNAACHFADIDDAEKAALDREIAKRIGSDGVPPARAQALEGRAQQIVAEKKQSNAKLCAGDGGFAGNVREMFDASADRPKRSQ
jgi:tetratricopeptide (TPR) repeat protein